MGLKEFYYKLEDKYYAFMDSLEQKGIKVYEYFIDPIEKRGIPSFPIFTLLVLLVLSAIGFLAFSVATGAPIDLGPIFGGSSFGTATLSVRVSGPDGPLSGVLVKMDGEGKTLTATTTAGIAVFRNVAKGKKLSLSINQEGYDPYVSSITIPADKNSEFIDARLTQSASLSGNNLFFYVHDQDGNPLPSAKVTYRDNRGLRYDLLTDADGRSEERRVGKECRSRWSPYH